MESEQSAPQGVFVARLVLGLAQGLALYLLYSAFDQKVWPATVPMLFAPLTVVALFVPLVVSQALGNLRTTTLLIWTVAAVLIVAGLSWYDVWHAWPGAPTGVVPSGRAFLVCGVFLFVAHALVSCGDADRRIVAHYPTLFDLAWKLGVQAAITVCFVGAFWIMLWLGIALFNMIKLTGFATFIEHPWVSIPLTTIAAAAAIHVTDTRANLVRGVRTLALTLLGWLLPVIALIAFAFLISLVFTGLTPLWETRSATFLLMAAAVVLIIHINAAYQGGDTRPPHILRVAGTLAAVLLVFIVWIAGYALWLRVGQYGWTVDRITSAAGVLIAGVFAVGYLIAALLPGMWLKLIERWNVYGTFIFLIVLFALCTPIADPMRLSVADQMHRLQTGVVNAEKFDVGYLQQHGGRFGRDAIAQLATSPDKKIAALAKKPSQTHEGFRLPQPAAPNEILAQIHVWPATRPLPASFTRADRRDDKLKDADFSDCFVTPAHARCDALVRDFTGDGREDVLLILSNTYPDGSLSMWKSALFVELGGRWISVAVTQPSYCARARRDLLAGRYEIVHPSIALPDLKVADGRIALVRSEAPEVCK